jgi:PPIC-type PPIASE domain
MSTTLPTSDLQDLPRSRLPRWSREPLLHFVLLGAVLFAIDHFIVGRADDPRSIVVTAQVDSEARDLFTARSGREPTRAERDAMRRIWLDNEVLYREGLALQVDRGDTTIRERVIFKALSVVDASLTLPPFDDKSLREWFEANRAKYDEPARYDFQEAALYGDTSESAVRDFADALNRGTPGDAKAGLRVFKGRPHANLVESYGADFAKELAESPPGQWRAYKTGSTWRAMRLESIAAGRPAVFETLRGVVLQDWTDLKMAEQRTAAVRALAGKYTVKYEDAAK